MKYTFLKGRLLIVGSNHGTMIQYASTRYAAPYALQEVDGMESLTFCLFGF